MIKKILIGIMLILSLTSVSYADTIFEKMDNVSIDLKICTGVLVSIDDNYSYIQTARHCTTIDMVPVIKNHYIVDIYKDNINDLAIFKIKGHFKNKKVVTFSKINVKLRDSVYHLGYPALTKKDRFFNTGKVMIKIIGVTHVKMTVYPGCSGGGVFNKYGQLVGIVIQLNPVLKTAIFHNLQNVKNLMNKHGIKYQE